MISAGSRDLESSIAPHLLVDGRTPKHRPGTYAPPYPSFSARFEGTTTAVVMAYLGVQAEDAGAPALAAALDDLRSRLGEADGPASWDRARYVDARGCTTVVSIAYWTDPSTWEAW